jgi:hypothetical protein
MAATQFPIVFEPEASGVISAYVPGVPVYAQGATQKQAERRSDGPWRPIWRSIPKPRVQLR